MPTTTKGERLLHVRQAAGFGEPRRAAEFARKIGIKPPSLLVIESGKTKSLGKSLRGYLAIGANLDYVESGRGAPLVKDFAQQIESNLDAQTLLSIFGELDQGRRQTLLSVARGFLRADPKPSANDPYKEDAPPRSDESRPPRRKPKKKNR